MPLIQNENYQLLQQTVTQDVIKQLCGYLDSCWLANILEVFMARLDNMLAHQAVDSPALRRAV